MRSARSWVALGAAGLAMSAAPVAVGVGAATAATGSHHTTPAHSRLSPAIERSHRVGKVRPGSRVGFDLTLSLRHAHAAHVLAHKVSTRGSGKYHQFLTTKQWTRRFAPSHHQVKAASHWLRAHNFHVDSVPADRLFVTAHGKARTVEHSFSTRLGYYRVNGTRVRLASNKLKLPATLARSAHGLVGANQSIEQAQISPRPADAEPAPPAGFRNPQPCSAYWGQKTDTADSPSLYTPFAPNRPYDICGYLPSQLRSAYGVDTQLKKGVNGHGVTVAIVDAYDSPTLLADAQKYFSINDPSHPLASSQFTDINPGAVTNGDLCAASGWYDEQSLDVEAVHAMAPGAHITFVGSPDCFDDNFLVAENTAITSGASVVSNSWDGALADLFDDTATHDAYDTVFEMANTTGVNVLYSSGDDGDNFADFGYNIPDYPASSPLVTAVGGTSLKVDKQGARNGEFGWSTAKQVLCAGVPNPNCGNATNPTGSLAWNSGSGGGTSLFYVQPDYQAGVVPDDIATRNSALFGSLPTRVLPDISMDADAQSGMLIGLTQTFPDGVYYDQFKEGGTSLASPLLAGVVADADQLAGGSVGFINPTIYGMKSGKSSSPIYDVTPGPDAGLRATIRVDYANTVDKSAGYNVSLRALDYEGPETFCDGTGNCATRPVTLTVDHGFDSMTGLGAPGSGFIPALAASAH